MTKLDHWQRSIGSRLKLRDLQVFLQVAQSRSMAQAAGDLGVSQPAISEVVASLEHALKVRLFDRSSRGVRLTIYGEALVKRAVSAFDELRQGVKDIEELTDPATGEVRIGCAETVAASILPPIIEDFSREHPGVTLQVNQVTIPGLQVPELRARQLDLVLARIVKPVAEDALADDVNVEPLFEDKLALVVGPGSPLYRRPRVDLADLVDEPWIVPPSDSWATGVINEAFRTRRLKPPNVRLVTFSLHLRVNLLASGRFVGVFFLSALRLYAERLSLRILPVALSPQTSTIAIVTLKNRTLGAAARRFVEHARAFSRGIAVQADGPTSSAKRPRSITRL